MSARNLVIVESPAKAKTINKYLGSGYEVVASLGHIKDLPKSRFGVDIDRDFAPEYGVIKGKSKVLKAIKDAAKKAEAVYLAPDPDREGEAIAWHIAQEIPVPEERIWRVAFNEITAAAVKKAFANPGRLDMDKVDAQTARRVLDRIVGYSLSPLLWRKVRKGLSAGRVQSVALRLICEREDEIRAFISREYWTISARLRQGDSPEFTARLEKVNGEKADIPDEAAARALRDRLAGRPFTVAAVATANRFRNPAAPFITSQLQQEAYRRLGFTVKKTMVLAQQLYEGIELPGEGQVALITYMRTDSPRISSEAQAEARDFIQGEYGGAYLPEKPNTYSAKKTSRVQDAHECIRPTSVSRRPETIEHLLDRDLARLYSLIWSRFLASQMTPARFLEDSADIAAGDCLFKAKGTRLVFDGHLRAFADVKAKDDDAEEKANGEEANGATLPPLAQGDVLTLEDLVPKQNFTQPPPRFTEATLIKILEENGIGRPSTYATIIATIQSRDYTEKKRGRLHPTDLGMLVNGLLVRHFPDIFNVEFTSQMEDRLDLIEEGAQGWVATLREFYAPFKSDLDRSATEMKNVKQEVEATDIVCDKCGRPMVIRWGKNGRFLSCSGYPECKNAKNFTRDEDNNITVAEPVPTDVTCDKCGRPMIIRQGRFGKFLACSGYPECKNTRPINRPAFPCPAAGCDGTLNSKLSRARKRFWGCSRYPACDFATWEAPAAVACPQCGSPTTIKKKGDEDTLTCPRKECGHRFPNPEAAAEA